MSNICPYCKEVVSIDKKYLSETIYYCDNHKNISVLISYNNGFIYANYIHLYNKEYEGGYHIYVRVEENEMIVRDTNFSGLAILPIDNNLTPENFEKKIKTYLTFQ